MFSPFFCNLLSCTLVLDFGSVLPDASKFVIDFAEILTEVGNFGLDLKLKSFLFCAMERTCPSCLLSSETTALFSDIVKSFFYF